MAAMPRHLPSLGALLGTAYGRTLLVKLALAAIVRFVVLPRSPEPDHPLRLAADPLPEEMDTAAEQAAWRAGSSRLWSLLTLEKVVLVGLLSVIFSQSLPGLHVSKLGLFVGVAVLILVNTAIVIAAARRQVSFESLLVTFLVRIAVNEALWKVEDDLRQCERQGTFGRRFVQLARSVYRHNDHRAALKRQVNELLGSRLIEEKTYTAY